jgi:hypothetical protein
MLSNCNYDKIKLLNDLSKAKWFIENHAKQDAEEEGHGLCVRMYEEIEEDLENSIAKLKEAIKGISKEDKL